MVASLFMEDFEARALGSSPNSPRIWLRFVDDTFYPQGRTYTTIPILP